MLGLRQVRIAAAALVVVANVASAQTAAPPAARDSLWNGTLFGLGVGVGSAAALDAVFCENGFGGCDFPWAAYLTLGGIGAGAGAGIDFLIGRRATERPTTLRLSPMVGRNTKGVLASLVLPSPHSLPALKSAMGSARQPADRRRDSVWNGTLIGAGVGAAGGTIWSLNTCGSNDTECFAIAGPLGIVGGAAIGAAVGAIADALHD
jgi:hypothetical protein